jgi:uncharacterized protein
VATSLRPGELPRLSKLIGHGPGVPEGSLDVGVEFRLGPESFPVVQIRVTGTIYLTCQRCLGPVSWPLDLDVGLTVVASDELAEELADPFDSVLLDEEGRLALRAAVEDEILAALPLVPRHEDAAACGIAGPQVTATNENSPRKANRPFADLGALMHRDDQGGGQNE